MPRLFFRRRSQNPSDRPERFGQDVRLNVGYVVLQEAEYAFDVDWGNHSLCYVLSWITDFSLLTEHSANEDGDHRIFADGYARTMNGARGAVA